MTRIYLQQKIYRKGEAISLGDSSADRLSKKNITSGVELIRLTERNGAVYVGMF